MSRYPSLPDKPWNNAAPGVHLAKIGRIFMLLIFLLSMVGGSVTSVQAATAINFTAGELLSRPTDDSIMISIVPDTTIEYQYQYGLVAGSYTWQTSNYTATGGQPHEIVISGLQANTQYYYRMRYHAPGDLPNDWVIREEHSFDLTQAGSYYYVVASMSAGDAPIGASNRTGVFVYGVAPGSGP
jgi:hypothetical protein